MHRFARILYRAQAQPRTYGVPNQGRGRVPGHEGPHEPRDQGCKHGRDRTTGGIPHVGGVQQTTRRKSSRQCALVRRVVRRLSEQAEEQLETEYASGSAWVRDSKVSSAAASPGEAGKDDLYEDFQIGGPAWINVRLLAEELGVGQATVRETIEELKR